MTTIKAALEARVQAITDAGDVTAYTDERKAFANRPCLLAAPPILDYVGGTMCGPRVTFRFLALSSFNAPSFDAITELQDLITAADGVLDIERAEPIQYPTRTREGKAGAPVAAYLITTTDYPL